MTERKNEPYCTASADCCAGTQAQTCDTPPESCSCCGDAQSSAECCGSSDERPSCCSNC
jgi:hypothetical protein